MGSRTMRKIQIGKEVTPGTGVAATTILRLNGTLEDLREQKFSEEDVGQFSGTDRSYEVKQASSIDLEGEATFEQLPYILNAGIDEVAGVQDGTGTDYVYTYNLPTTAVPDKATYTIEAGDDEGAEEIDFGIVEEFSLAGGSGEEVKLTAKLAGGNPVPSSYTGSLTLPPVDTILFGKGKVYIDAVSGNWGTTQVSNQVIGFTLKFKTGVQHRWSADGTLEPTHLGHTPPEVELEVTFEHEASAIAEKVNWRAMTSRLIQLKFEGPTVATPGTAYSNKTLIINLVGRWSKFSKLDENDGNDVVTGTFVGKYNATKASAGQIIVVNELASLP